MIALALVASGCGENPTPEEVAKFAQQTLNIPVMLWAQNTDVCVTRQLGAFYQEVKKANDKQKAELPGKFKAYSAIVIQVSEDAGTVKSDSYEVRLSKKTCREWIEPASFGDTHGYGGGLSPTTTHVYCDTDRVATKRVAAPWQVSANRYPGTRIDKVPAPDGGAPILYLTPAGAKDESVRKVVDTNDERLFAALGSTDTAPIESALLSKSAKLVSSNKAPAINCGKLLKLSDLF
jgi:hypothetical protein